MAFLLRSNDLNTNVLVSRTTTRVTIITVGKAKPAFAKFGRLPIFSKIRTTVLTTACTVTSDGFRSLLSRRRAIWSGCLRIDRAAFGSDVGAADGGEFKS